MLILDRGQLLIVSLYGYGAYGSRASLARAGVLDDFVTMANSARALESARGRADHTRVIASLNADVFPFAGPDMSSVIAAPSAGVLPAQLFTLQQRWMDKKLPAGVSHCHGSTCGYDFYWYMGVSYDPSTHFVDWIYEEMWYRHSNAFTKTLFRTEVSDTQYWCETFEGQFIAHTIGADTSSSHYTVNDTYQADYKNSSINGTTFHGEVFGDPGLVYCMYWKPFY